MLSVQGAGVLSRTRLLTVWYMMLNDLSIRFETSTKSYISVGQYSERSDHKISVLLSVQECGSRKVLGFSPPELHHLMADFSTLPIWLSVQSKTIPANRNVKRGKVLSRLGSRSSSLLGDHVILEK